MLPVTPSSQSLHPTDAKLEGAELESAACRRDWVGRCVVCIGLPCIPCALVWRWKNSSQVPPLPETHCEALCSHIRACNLIPCGCCDQFPKDAGRKVYFLSPPERQRMDIVEQTLNRTGDHRTSFARELARRASYDVLT